MTAIKLSQVWFSAFARMPDDKLKELVNDGTFGPVTFDPALRCVVIGKHLYPIERVERMTVAEDAEPAPKRRGRPPKVKNNG